MNLSRCRVAICATVIILATPLQLLAQADDPFASEPTYPDSAPPAGDPEPEPEPQPSQEEPASFDLGASMDAQLEADAEASAPTKDADVPKEKEEEIVVTGSRIKRNSFAMPTPVMVVKREEIAKSGASNMGDLIRFLTANSGSETQFGLGQGATGSSNFNLRGLGLANTLVLINGRRLVPYPDSFGVTNSSTFVDVNQIPLKFIERIEIAKGGASAIYGSDAIAGVVNIILRRDFEGAAVSLTGFTTDRWDQQDGEISAIFGANSDDSSVVAQASYFERAPLGAVDRDFTKGTLESTIGNPGTFVVLPEDADPYAVPDEDCGVEGTDSFLNDAGDRCMFDYRKDWNLFNPEKRILAYVTAEHRPSDLFQIFGELGFARKEYIYNSYLPIHSCVRSSYRLTTSTILMVSAPDFSVGR